LDLKRENKILNFNPILTNHNSEFIIGRINIYPKKVGIQCACERETHTERERERERERASTKNRICPKRESEEEIFAIPEKQVDLKMTQERCSLASHST
jgi:hypothetical protein